MENIKLKSEKKIEVIKANIKEKCFERINKENVCIYVCGSLGRLEMTVNSDLDLFFISLNDENNKVRNISSNINKYLFFSELYRINNKLKYEDPSREGLYWDFISKKNLLDIGSNIEDYNNGFTARMLLILESKPIINEDAYNKLAIEIIDKYFKDYIYHKKDFYPLFLMNDILRYWYTLTLNYEYGRDSNDDENKKNWRRLKLKYARLITCFSMIACLYKKEITPGYVIDCIYKTPFERLDMLSSCVEGVKEIVAEIVQEYKWFLSLRKQRPQWWDIGSNKSDAYENADHFHKLVIHKFMRLISNTNHDLQKKVDIYGVEFV